MARFLSRSTRQLYSSRSILQPQQHAVPILFYAEDAAPKAAPKALKGKIKGMMFSTIRRKAVSAGSSALANYRAKPALSGSTLRSYIAAIATTEAFNHGRGSQPQFHQGAPVYSQPLRDVVSSLNTDFPMQKWARYSSSISRSSDRVDVSGTIAQVETNKGIHNAENRASIGRISFTLSGGALGASIINPPQAANLSVGAVLSPTFLPNLALLWHINNGMEEILADYVHHEMTRSLVLVMMRLFLIVAAKDVFVATN